MESCGIFPNLGKIFTWRILVDQKPIIRWSSFDRSRIHTLQKTHKNTKLLLTFR